MVCKWAIPVAVYLVVYTPRALVLAPPYIWSLFSIRGIKLHTDYRFNWPSITI